MKRMFDRKGENIKMTKQKEMAKIVYDALDEKKGEDIKIIDISEVSIMADYFVVASGSSTTQIQALVRNVEENLHKGGYRAHTQTRRIDCAVKCLL